MNPPIPESDDLLLAEFAFGLLDLEEATRVRDRIDADPAFAERLAAWETLTAALLDGSAEPPRPSLWTGIAAALPGNDDELSTPNLAGRWRAASLALGVLAAVLGVFALWPFPPAPPPVSIAAPGASDAAPLVAVLRAPREAGALAVSFDPTTARLTLAADALAAGAGSVELWVIPQGGAPHSLGLVDAATPARRAAGEAARWIVPGATLAITLEPKGGSPTGQPTTTPLLTGAVAAAATGEHGA